MSDAGDSQEEESAEGERVGVFWTQDSPAWVEPKSPCTWGSVVDIVMVSSSERGGWRARAPMLLAGLVGAWLPSGRGYPPAVRLTGWRRTRKPSVR